MPAMAESARPFGNRCSYPIASTFSQTGCPSEWFAFVRERHRHADAGDEVVAALEEDRVGHQRELPAGKSQAGTGFDMEALMEGARQRDAHDPDGGRQAPVDPERGGTLRVARLVGRVVTRMRRVRVRRSAAPRRARLLRACGGRARRRTSRQAAGHRAAPDAMGTTVTEIHRRAVPRMTPATAAMIIAAAIAVRAPIGSPASAAPSTTAISGLTNAPVDARVGPA